jgi:hypothetical protein
MQMGPIVRREERMVRDWVVLVAHPVRLAKSGRENTDAYDNCTAGRTNGAGLGRTCSAPCTISQKKKGQYSVDVLGGFEIRTYSEFWNPCGVTRDPHQMMDQDAMFHQARSHHPKEIHFPVNDDESCLEEFLKVLDHDPRRKTSGLHPRVLRALLAPQFRGDSTPFISFEFEDGPELSLVLMYVDP